MNKVIRVIISIPLSVVVAILMGTLLSLAMAFLLSGPSRPKGGPTSADFATAYAIAVFVTTLPAIVAGAVIPLFNLRPLLSAVAGASAQTLFVMVILAFFGAPTNPAFREQFLPLVAWAMCYIGAGAVAGFLCGLLSPRKKTEVSARLP